MPGGLRCVLPYKPWYDFLLLRYCKQLYLLPFLSYFTFNNIVTLKSGLEVTQDHSNWYHSKDCMGAVSYSCSIVTMALSCISSEIKPDIHHHHHHHISLLWVVKTQLNNKKVKIELKLKLVIFSYPHAFGAPVRGVPVGVLPSRSAFVRENWSGGATRRWKNLICVTVYTHYWRVTDGRTDGRTDRQTSCHGIVRAMHTRRAVKTQFIDTLTAKLHNWNSKYQNWDFSCSPQCQRAAQLKIPVLILAVLVVRFFR